MSAVEALQQVVVFTLGAQRYGLALAAVEHVVRIVEITPLPQAPEIVLGIINVQGRLMPVMNLRRRFRLPEREPALNDQMIIARLKQRSVALVVESVAGVLDHAPREAVASGDILPDSDYVDCVVKLEDGLILIHDLDRFLSSDETRSLDAAMKTVQ
ncbi:MAG TPA: chemotaxis protein CheW [Burkholderiales bacterium]